MFYGQLRKAGNSFVVTVPKEEVERLNLDAGALLAVHVQPAEMHPILDDVRQAFEDSWKANEAGYRYLSNRWDELLTHSS